MTPRSLSRFLSRSFLVPLTGGVVLMGSLSAQPVGPTPPEVETISNLTYVTHGDKRLQLDLFRPAGQKGVLPGVVCIHGGGWQQGERGQHAALARAIAAHGYVTVTISYRLSGELPFPAQIHDAKAAVRWLRAHAAKYHLDPTAIGAVGHSAGGHLAALLATSGGVSALEGTADLEAGESTVQAVVAFGAQSDLTAAHIQANHLNVEKLPMWSKFLGGAYRDVPERYRAASPLTYLDRSDPPLAFITGERDSASTRADGTRRELMRLGIPTRLTVIKEAGHGIFQRPEWAKAVVENSVGFLDLHLKNRSRPLVQSAPEHPLAPIFPANARWQTVGGGYAGCEGAQWIEENGEPTLLFSAQHDFFVFRWNERNGLRPWRDDSPEATAFRPDGRGGFFVVEQTNRTVVRWDADGKRTEVLCDRFEGKRLNRPNDVVLRRDGTLWFSDPDFLFKQRPGDVKELEGQFLYRFDPKKKDLRAVVRDLKTPNGLTFSPDDRFFYFDDSAGDAIFRASVAADGTLGPREVFARIPAKGLDGLAFDAKGRLWCAAMDGVHVFDASGKELGTLRLPYKPTSIAFSAGAAPFVCVTTREAAFVTRLQP